MPKDSSDEEVEEEVLLFYGINIGIIGLFLANFYAFNSTGFC
jgi:hypothetical protein